MDEDNKALERRPPGDPFWRQAFLSWAERTTAGVLVFHLPDEGSPEDLILVHANPAASEADDKDLSSHLGRRILEVFPGLRDTDLPDTYAETARGGLPVRVNHFLYEGNPEGPHYELDVLPFPDRHVAAVFHNISKRMHALGSAARAEALIRSSHDAIVAKDLEGVVTDWNPAAEELYGYTPEEMLGRSMERLVPEEGRDEWRDLMRRVAAGETVEQLETERLRRDGSRVLVSLRISPILGLEGEVLGASAISRDVTELRRIAQLHARSEELREENRRIQEANRVKSEFVANMSHDLRTPLNSIMGFTKLLLGPRTAPLTADQEAYLRHVLTASEDLLQLVNDILDLARVESGKIEFAPEPLSLTEVLDEVRQLLREAAAERRIRIELEVAPAVERVVLDRRRLKQILYNYLSNAVKFSQDGGRVSVRAEPAGEGAFRLSVQDEGMGVAPEKTHLLFREFQQLDQGPDKRHPGTGLGLAIVRRLVEAQGGEVGVRSAQGEGSEFWAILPVEAAVASPVEARGAAASWHPEILVVEDDPAQASWMQEVLDAAGYPSRVVTSGRDAIRIGQERHFSAVMLDLLLPDLSGWEVARALRALGPNRDTPLFVVSVVPEENLANAVRIDEFLSKPVDAEEVRLALQRHGIRGARRPILVLDEDAETRERICAALADAGFSALPCASPDEAAEAFVAHDPGAVILSLVSDSTSAPQLLARLRSLDGEEHRPVIVHADAEVSTRDQEHLLRWAAEVVPSPPQDLDPLLQALRRYARCPSSGGNRTP